GVDAAAPTSTQSSGAPEGSRTEVRVASATARISDTGETLADPSATSGSSSATPSLTSSGDAAAAAPTADDSSLSRKQLLQGAAIGLVAGLASGYVGVGGGFIMVPLMLSIIGIPMRKASGTSLIAVMILAIPGVIEQGIIGNINYLAGIAIVIGTIPGAVIGARLVTKVPERTLRLLFGCFLIVAAVMLVLNEVGIFG
ncbi:sulfite exporter TauE/SafE family protein, partial [Ellagibacter isourolithinifaciens]